MKFRGQHSAGCKVTHLKELFSVENYLQDSLNTAHDNPNWGTTRVFLKYTTEKITVK